MTSAGWAPETAYFPAKMKNGTPCQRGWDRRQIDASVTKLGDPSQARGSAGGAGYAGCR